MPLPSEIQRLCAQYLLVVRDDLKHELSATQRLHIYHSFYPGQYNQPLDFVREDGAKRNPGYRQFREQQRANVTQADYALGWLAVLSAEKVLPRWDAALDQIVEYNWEVFTPQQIINIAKQFLQHEITIEQAFEESDSDAYLGTTREGFFTYEVSCSYNAAYAALHDIVLNHADTKIAFTCGEFFNDFVEPAILAYAVVDKNPPGAWNDVEMRKGTEGLTQLYEYGAADEKSFEDLLALASDVAVPGLQEILRKRISQSRTHLQNFIPLEYDIQKQLEFWEWWLGEAVPQAWELGEQSWSNRLQ